MKSSKLSKRQKKFVKEIAAGCNPGEAALAANYSDRDYGYALMRSPKIKAALVVAMEKVGVDDDLIAQKIKEGLNALTVPKFRGQERVEDQFIRRQFIDLVLKVRGDYAPEKFEHVEKSVHIQLDGELIKALMDAKAIDKTELAYLLHEPIESLEEGNEVIEAQLVEENNNDTQGEEGEVNPEEV